MIRARYHVNTLWKLALVSACAAMVVLWPNWRVALQTFGYYQEEGRMTGGGKCTFDTGEVVKVTHGFELHCDCDPVCKKPNNLQVNWEDETGRHRFHLKALQTAICPDDPSFSEGQPPAGFDTHIGSGTGTFDGAPGATASWVLTDQGEPGINKDTLDIVISQEGEDVLDVTCTLNVVGGNHQAHRK